MPNSNFKWKSTFKKEEKADYNNRISVVYNDVFSSDAGDIILQDLKTKFLEEQQELFDSNNQFNTAYQCGMRDTVCYIIRMINLYKEKTYGK